MYILGNGSIIRADDYLVLTVEEVNCTTVISAYGTNDMQKVVLEKYGSISLAREVLTKLFAAMKRGEQFIDINNLSEATEGE